MDMPRPVSATSDIVFKYLFGSRASTHLLQSFLNAVFADSGDPLLSELEITNPINDKQYFDGRLHLALPGTTEDETRPRHRVRPLVVRPAIRGLQGGSKNGNLARKQPQPDGAGRAV